MSQIDWNDFSYCLAVIREGSLSAAANVLGVNHTTVSRRISALEKQLGVPMFDRSTAGWHITPVAESILANMEIMEDQAQAIQRAVSADSKELSGHLRVTALDICIQRIILPHLQSFSEAYPDITLELLSSDDVLDLSSRAADVAFRATDDPSPDVVGKKIANFAYSIYGRKDVCERVMKGDPDIGVIGWANVMDQSRPEWLGSEFDHCKIRYRANSLNVVLELCLQGSGIALLPCGLGDLEPSLQRLGELYPFKPNSFWLLTHTDLRTTARIRLFRDYFMECIRPDIPLLEGEWQDAWRMPQFQEPRVRGLPVDHSR